MCHFLNTVTTTLLLTTPTGTVNKLVSIKKGNQIDVACSKHCDEYKLCSKGVLLTIS